VITEGGERKVVDFWKEWGEIGCICAAVGSVGKGINQGENNRQACEGRPRIPEIRLESRLGRGASGCKIDLERKTDGLGGQSLMTFRSDGILDPINSHLSLAYDHFTSSDSLREHLHVLARGQVKKEKRENAQFGSCGGPFDHKITSEIECGDDCCRWEGKRRRINSARNFCLRSFWGKSAFKKSGGAFPWPPPGSKPPTRR